MAATKPELIIGARGWNHAHWQGSFYPDDLPEEWRFSYYSNEFHAVLVPWEYLLAAGPGVVQEWVDEVNEQFVFFIEVVMHLSWEKILPLIKPLAPQLGGIYLRNIESKRTALLSDTEIETLMSKAGEFAPIIVDVNPLNQQFHGIVARCSAGCYWQPENRVIKECRANIALAETVAMTKHNPKSLKKIMEDCRSVRGPTTIGFFIGGVAPNMEDLRNATMIWQMLG